VNDTNPSNRFVLFVRWDYFGITVKYDRKR